MAKQTYVCPECQKQVRDLKAHIKRIHADAQAQTEPESEPKPEADTEQYEKLEVQSNEPEGGAEYYCVTCGHEFKTKVPHCPKCGGVFDWSVIDG